MTRGLFAGVVCLVAALFTAPWIIVYARKPWQYTTLHFCMEIEFHAGEFATENHVIS